MYTIIHTIKSLSINKYYIPSKIDSSKFYSEQFSRYLIKYNTKNIKMRIQQYTFKLLKKTRNSFYYNIFRVYMTISVIECVTVCVLVC